MPIRISDTAAYRSVGPVWVILCYVITILLSDYQRVLIVMFPHYHLNPFGYAQASKP